MGADPHPRGWFESSPPERQAIVRAHRELWAECVRECEEVPPESTLQDDDRLNLRPGGIKTNVWQ